MEQIKLGNTDLSVSRLGLGSLFAMADPDQTDAARAALKHALGRGINYFDTAPTYGDSEQVLGRALEGVDEPLVLSSKLGGRPKPFDPRDVRALRQSVETSLSNLGRDCLDILMIHEPDRPGQYDWWTDMLAVEGPVLDLLADLKAEGKIRYTGVGGTTVYEMAHICASGKFDVVLTAFNYNLLWREAADAIIPAAKAQGMGIIIGSPLQQGVLAVKHPGAVSPDTYWLSEARREQFRRLYAFVDDCGIPLPELALRFTLSHPDAHTVLTGAADVEQIDANADAAERGPLPDDVLARLDEIAALVPYRPYGEPDALGWRLAAPHAHKGPGGIA